MKIASRDQIKALERAAMEALGLSEGELIARAGTAAALSASKLLPGKNGLAVVFCGRGKNGADGLAAALTLREMGIEVMVFTVGQAQRSHPETIKFAGAYGEAGGAILPLEDNFDRACEVLRQKNCRVVLDAVFGTGVDHSRPPDEIIKQAVGLINGFRGQKISLDIPSGIDPDTGQTWEVFVRADRTITFILPKPAHFLSASRGFCGELELADIGIPDRLIAGADIPFETFDRAELEADISPRRQNTHKGDYGRLLIIAGSVGYVGAAVMAARAALRTGAGMVSLCVPERIYEISAAKLDEAMVFPLPCDDEGRFSAGALPQMLRHMENCDTLLAGCGLGRGGDIPQIVFELIKRAGVPLILDADGLNALSLNINILKEEHSELILTPHPGEFRRLFGEQYALKDENDPAAAMRLAGEYRCVVVMKNHRTITAAADAAFINLSGNAGMAKGGSGDVLAGIIASFAAQGKNPLLAAACGVALHGGAGDLAADRFGQFSMLPNDIIGAVPEILKTAERRKSALG